MVFHITEQERREIREKVLRDARLGRHPKRRKPKENPKPPEKKG